MNERTKELERQATETVKCGLNGTSTTESFNRKKFAELIVRECIDKITTYDLVPGHSAKWEDIYYTHARLLQDLGEELKEHFGIDE